MHVPISQVSPQAAAYLVKYVVDSLVTDLGTSSGPHGLSLSTTMDDDVFMDGTLREVEEKTADSQDEMSERSEGKVSPGAVRQEVSQAISDKKGTLIILKETEEKEDTEGDETSAEKEEVNAEVNGTKEEEERSLKIEIKTDEKTHIKGIDSPKKAMASWISEDVKTEASKIVIAAQEEVKEIKTSDAPLQKPEIFTFQEVRTEQTEPGLNHVTLSESSTTTLAVVLYENRERNTDLAASPITTSLPPCSSQTRLTRVRSAVHG